MSEKPRQAWRGIKARNFKKAPRVGAYRTESSKKAPPTVERRGIQARNLKKATLAGAYRPELFKKVTPIEGGAYKPEMSEKAPPSAACRPAPGTQVQRQLTLHWAYFLGEMPTALVKDLKKLL